MTRITDERLREIANLRDGHPWPPVGDEGERIARELLLARSALRQIVDECGMSREEFVMRGPAFACAQVERAVCIARHALLTIFDEATP